MAYSLSAEEIVQLMGIKSGALTDIIETALNSSETIEQLEENSSLVRKIYDISNEIDTLSSELLRKVSNG